MDTAHMPHLPPHLPNLHFLVAEADPVQRRALADALTQLGASRVTEVPDAPMALRTLQAGFSPNWAAWTAWKCCVRSPRWAPACA
jgi:hypothetical protein